jgi:peptidoglycan/xylan/chitin deacetylase (PgdA/CDA1 family)
MSKEILCAIGVHCDAVAGWLGSYGGENSPCDISRGVFAAEIGMPRLLRLFAREDIRTTWYIPGHTAESFPGESAAAVEAGHEIGLHGYSHENPLAMSRTQEEAVLGRSFEVLERICGVRPRGYVAPWWEFSEATNELLLESGVLYDNSLMHDDVHPYYVRAGDTWTPIDYTQPAEAWMKPFTKGQETDLVEIPGSWYLDDLPPMMFIKASPNSHGYVNVRDVEQSWRDQFDYIYREEDYAVFPLTIHPDVSGRPQVILMVERFIEYVRSCDGARWVTYGEIAEDFMRRVPPPSAR